MIDLVTQVQKLDVNVLQRALSDIKTQAVGVLYASVEADAEKQADVGKIVIFDDGADRRIYFKTGEGSVGYVTLTMV